MLTANMGYGLLTFTPIYWRLYLNMSTSYTAFFNALNYAPKVYVCTDVCLFDEQVVRAKPNTERSPVIDIPVILSFPYSAFTNMSRSN